MRLAERDPTVASVLTEAVKTRVASVMAREVATSKGFVEDIAFTFTISVERDPQARQWLMTSALSSPALKEALIQKLAKELS
jgi:hypothetical protein